MNDVDHADLQPELRYVEATPVPNGEMPQFVLHDPLGLAVGAVTVSEPALYIIAHFDGQRRLRDIEALISEQFGQPIDRAVLMELVDTLRQAQLLAGPSFDAYYAQLVANFRAAPTRKMRSADALGLDGAADLQIAEMLAANPCTEKVPGRIVGLVAPHLDYPRGKPCYSAAYSVLVNRPAPARVVILGTNHFGLSTSVVATGKPFETPLGVTQTDTAFLDRLEACCGPLTEGEFDHSREHSVELQVLIAQHLWGADRFKIVPVLCPDPCGPTGTAPIDGAGPDLAAFARGLGQLLDEDPDDTLVIAGADLSHIGPQFGDERALDATFAGEVQLRDERALAQLAENDAERFRRVIAEEGNPTRVCSAGCIFATMTALAGAEARVLRYHQALDADAGCGVTCAAAVFTR